MSRMEIEGEILQYITGSSTKTSFGELKRHLTNKFQRSRAEVKAGVSTLVQSGTLSYTTHFGISFLEVSYDRPVVVSENVVLKPPAVTYLEQEGVTVLSLEKGVSFGSGDHPSTRLAIQLIDFVFTNGQRSLQIKGPAVLDIGTGSGVLGILAAELGADCVCCVDTDPCSVFEAERNVFHNGVEKKATILCGDLDVVCGTYNVVLANLRAPTLLAIRDAVEKKLSESGLLIFSGIKTEEATKICQEYEKAGFFLKKMVSEKGWSACCLLRRGLEREPLLSTE